jgi:NAD(P)-dependent dehydrogenase (short-subunit alcohol dehydrogenase family)
MGVHPMDDQVVVITGGNSGIGLETAVALAAAGAEVVLGCRDRPKATAAVEEVRRRSGSDRVRSSPLDLADLGSVRDFAAALAAELDRVDVLVNNAGLMLDRRTETAQGFETVFGVNHLGHFLLTDMLLDQLRAAPRGRIVVVASDAHRLAVGGLRWGDLDRHRGRYHPWRAYAESKLANILHARALAARLEGTGVVAHSLHPGSVATNFAGEGDTRGRVRRMVDLARPLSLSPAEGARTSIHVATSPEAGACTGLYWARERIQLPSRPARERGAPEELWALSRRMLAAVG